MLGANDQTYAEKILALFGSSIVAYWPMWEPSGIVSTDISGRNHPGAYTGVTLGQPGIGDGRTAARFDGITSFNNIYSVGLAADFNGAEGGFAAWAQASLAALWTDGGQHQIAIFLGDTSNYARIVKSTVNNTLSFEYVAGGTAKVVTSTALAGSTAWFHVALTWSKAADQVKAYINGAQVGVTQTGLGVFAGAIGATTTVIGARSTAPTEVWGGNLAHIPLLNRAPTAGEVFKMATVA